MKIKELITTLKEMEDEDIEVFILLHNKTTISFNYNDVYLMCIDNRDCCIIEIEEDEYASSEADI